MRKIFNIVHPNSFVGVLLLAVITMTACNEQHNEFQKKGFSKAVDSLVFNYVSDTWKKTNPDYSENQFGYTLLLDTNKNFKYFSIDSDNQLHTFDFKTSIHSFSNKIVEGDIQAYLLDSLSIKIIANDVFYIKDYQLNTIDSFKFNSPKFYQEHGIDFSVENGSNLFRVKDYYALMYYVVDDMPDGSNLYRNSDYLFYFFNRDTAFFSNKGCQHFDSSFQYFRYPAIASDLEHLYHAPRVMNCISKSNNTATVLNTRIDTVRENYLSINHSDQYEMSRLKKYRFSTDYNRDLILSDNYLYLIKEIPEKIYYKDNVREYKRFLEIRKFDKQLELQQTFYIQDIKYSFVYIKHEKLYLFKFQQNKALIYDL